MGTVFLENCHFTKKKVEGLPLWNDFSTWTMTFRDCNGSTEEIAQHGIRSAHRIYSRIGVLVVMYQKVPVYRFYHVYKPCEESISALSSTLLRQGLHKTLLFSK